MNGQDPELHPETTFLVFYPGGAYLVIARVPRQVRILIHSLELLSEAELNISEATPDEIYVCTAHGVQTIIAIP